MTAPGNLVLVTDDWSGNPKDPWDIGWLCLKDGIRVTRRRLSGTGDRRYRRYYSISQQRATWLIRKAEEIAASDRSLYWWVRQPFNYRWEEV